MSKEDEEYDVDENPYEDDVWWDMAELPYIEDNLPEPEIDVCQSCGAYFNWDGIMRQRKLADMKVEDGPSYQRCFNCL
jgi:hypothetical protein